MCGENHVGLSFIYPILLNMANNTLSANESDLAAIRSFKNTVRKELITRFKLLSRLLAESIPIPACMLDPRFKQLKFLPDDVREEAQARLTQLVREDGEVEQPGATGEEEIADNVGVELAETCCKKARLESDFEQLFGAHFESSSKRKWVNSDADHEQRDYCQRTPHIPTMDNPLEWWAENVHRFPRLAKLSRSYLTIPATSTPKSIPIPACMLDPRFKQLKFLPDDVREEAQARLTQLVREDGEVEQPGATGEEEIADNVGVELAETSCKKARLETLWEARAQNCSCRLKGTPSISCF
ncbi:hypothetical protein JOQ06_009566 [Pogonophryne albipinna]|uniref:HAT C-terminal dimerisation domain-containing protein n=1 Tax=Pogonophryne albipinna TaxID=1090488 RepID=A0AAD6BQT1_9TELE|nr:hypothetical protein JOQ06_009566 [Pogonophryne albipinna]